MFGTVSSIIISVIIAVFIGSKDCIACFRNDEHKTNIIPTGSSFYQECHCSEPGYNMQYLKWTDINNEIITAGPGTDSLIYVEKQSDGLNIHIPKVSKSMSGAYKCITNFEGQQYVQTHTIEAYDPLYFINAAEVQHIMESQDSRINCEARGEYPPLITWHKGEENALVEIQNSEKYSITKEGLIVRNVTTEDGGTYKCTAMVMVTGEEVDRFIKVEVMTVPIIQDIIGIPNTIVMLGSKLSVECIAEAKPQPEYIWNKVYTGPNDEGNQTWKQVANTLIFDDIKGYDAGYYECTAYNMAGNSTSGALIEVLVPPEIFGFDNMTAEEGTNIKIACEALGIPKPNITVTTSIFDSDENGEKHTELPLDWSFVVERYHKGVYYCNAINEVGNASKTMYLTVLHKPYFEYPTEDLWGWNGKVFNLSCSHESEPPSVISWRFQGNEIPTAEQVELNKQLIEKLNNAQEQYLPVNIDENFLYGVYECVAKNAYGEATKTITLKKGFVPSVVNNVTIEQQAATSITFSIQEPSEYEGPEVIGYTAEYDQAANYEITHIHLNRTWAINRPFKLEKLKPNTTHHVKFAAINEAGTGPWSETLVFETLERSVPEPPVLDSDYVQIESPDNVLKWKAPADNGDSIDYYAVRYCPVDDDSDGELCGEERIGENTEFNLSSLEHNTTYFVEIIAHNAQGNSTPSNITLITAALSTHNTLGLLSAGAIIGIAVVVVVICLVLLDLVLCAWRKQGIIATCCSKKTKDDELKSRDEKGLLRDNGDLEDCHKRPDKGHKEYEYNKSTGIITGKHSAV
ncbi:fasciclin-2-like isoform X1 [Bombyx mandarina]|uniref:Fasciclin-2-like isoform X1 n=1 Tax=Bombyx mandarina TaxID=7092 RepID=A0A6J2JEB6_BOMMA|nr:fasciclin-2-like isoform X1 [Bombyx mandarina]